MGKKTQQADEAQLRESQRGEVCVAVEVRLVESATGDVLSDWLHAVVRDASAGGFRLHALGEVQRLFARTRAGQVVQIRFLPKHLHNDFPLEAEVRWSRPRKRGRGWALGVRAHHGSTDEARQIVAALEQFGRRRDRTLIKIGVVILVVAALAVALWQSQKSRSELRTSMRECWAEVDARHEQMLDLQRFVEQIEVLTKNGECEPVFGSQVSPENLGDGGDEAEQDEVDEEDEVDLERDEVDVEQSGDVERPLDEDEPAAEEARHAPEEESPAEDEELRADDEPAAELGEAQGEDEPIDEE